MTSHPKQIYKRAWRSVKRTWRRLAPTLKPIARSAVPPLVITLFLSLYVVVLWFAPLILDPDARSAATPAQILDAEYKARWLLASAGGAIFVGLGLVYTARNYKLSRRGQMTDRFAQALERLESDELYIRVGAIRALEQVMRDSPIHHNDVMEILMAYLRRHAPNASEEPCAPPLPSAALLNAETPGAYARRRLPLRAQVRAMYAQASRRRKPKLREIQNTFNGEHQGYQGNKANAESRIITVDIQAALTAIARRPRHRNEVELRLTDLALPGARLENAYLRGAKLDRSNLESARFSEADLRGASMQRCNLRDAWLVRSRLDEVDLYAANLSGGNIGDSTAKRASLIAATCEVLTIMGLDLRDASLSGVNFRHSALNVVDLRGANFEGAVSAPDASGGSTVDGTEISITWGEQPLNALFGGDESSLLRADLQDTHFVRVKLSGAKLRGIDLSKTNLSRYENSTSRELRKAVIDSTTRLPVQNG